MAAPGAGAALAGIAAGQNALANDVLTIDRPSSGQMKIIDTAGARQLKFSFDISDCKVAILDVDVVLTFADGGKIVMPAFAMQILTAEPPKMQFLQLATEGHTLLSKAGEIKLADQLPQFALSDNIKTDNKTNEVQPPQAQVVQVTANQQYSPGPKTRPFVIEGNGSGDALQESNGRYAKQVDQSESQSSSTKGEGALTQNSQKADTTTATKVVDTNAAPTLTSPGQFTVDENKQLVGKIKATDADSGTVLSYAITGGADAAKFAVNSKSGLLYFVENPNFEARDSAAGTTRYEIVVEASDGKATDKQTIIINLQNVNEAPDRASITAATVSENTVTGSIVGSVAGMDPDAGSQLSYSFAPGGDAGGRFAIDGASGAVSVLRGDLIDFEASQSQLIVVRVTDQGGLFLDKPIVITVTDANDAPVITSNGGGASAAISVSENTSAVTIVAATDADSGSVITYSIVGGSDASKFTIDLNTGVLNFISTVDFEIPGDSNLDNIYNVVVQASDGRGGTDLQTLAVAVVNSNDVPDNLTLSASTVLENSPNGTVIGTLAGSDPDPGSVLRYSLIPGGDGGGRFAVNAITGVLTVIDGSRLDFETGPTQTIIARVTDQGGLSLDRAFVISLVDVNEAPTITSSGGGATAALTVGENNSNILNVSASDPENNTITYSITGGADAARFVINAATGALSFISPPDYEVPLDANGDNIYDLTIQASDGTLVDTQTLSITVVNTGEPPVITSNGGGSVAAVSLLEGGSAVTTVTAVDPDFGSVLTYAIVGGADAGRFMINAATGVLTLLAPADFENPLDADLNNAYEVTVQVSDGTLADTQAITLTIINQNDPPSITSDGGGATAAVTMFEGVTLATTVTAVDPDIGTVLIYTISGGADAAKFTINSATGALSFIAAPDFETPTDVGGDNVYDVQVQVLDGLGGVDMQTIAVTVINANEAPVITSNGAGAIAAVSTSENSTSVTTVTAADPDIGAVLSYSISGGADAAKFVVNATTGVLTFITAPDFDTAGDVGGNNVYDVIVQVSDGLGGIDTQAIAVTVTNVNEAPVITSNGGGAVAALSFQENGSVVTTVTATDQDAGTTLTYTLVGGADLAKFTINPTTGVLTFITAPDYEAPGDVGGDNVYDVTVQVSDGLGGIDTQAIAVSVTNQNEAPVITSNGGAATASVSVAENSTGVTTVTASDTDAGNTLSYSILSGADAAKFTINAATGVLTFVSAPDFDIAGDADANNIYEVIIQVSDGFGGIDTQAISVTLTNVNEAPVITSNGGGASAAISMQENGTAVATVAASDPDAGTTFIYTIIGGVDAAKFTINPATGSLTFVAAPDFEAPGDVGANNVYDVIVQVSDGLGGVDTQAIAVTITNQNEAPVITSNGAGATAAVSISENTTAVATVTSTDPDAGATKTFSLVGGADQAKFTINAATGVLTFIAAPNFEAPTDVGANNVYDVIVQVSDGLGGIDTQAIAVTVTNVNEAPVITSNGAGATATITMAENITAVTTVTSTDPDAGATKTFSIIGGVDAAKFSINAATGVLTFVAAPNFEAPTDVGANNVYDVTVQVSDGLGGIDTQAIAVTITNANEAPVITSNGGGGSAAISIAENGTAVTTVTATDPDAGATITYSISGGVDAAKFAINAATGVLTFIAAPNFEAPTDVGANNVYDVIVRASDGLGGIVTQSIAVTITDVNEVPVITSNGGGATASISVGENITAVTTVVAADPDAGATITYTIIGGADAAKFSINASTGVLTFIVAPDFQAPTDVGLNNVYDVIVQASDGSLVDTQAIAVTVTDVNQAPVITSDGGGTTAAISIAENGTAVTTVTATDPDAGATQTYSISGGADAAKFTINASTGVLTFISAPNFEAPTDVGGDNVYDVIVQVSDGTLVDTQAIAVTVTNVNEAPVITSNGGLATASISVAETAQRSPPSRQQIRMRARRRPTRSPAGLTPRSSASTPRPVFSPSSPHRTLKRRPMSAGTMSMT